MSEQWSGGEPTEPRSSRRPGYGSPYRVIVATLIIGLVQSGKRRKATQEEK